MKALRKSKGIRNERRRGSQMTVIYEKLETTVGVEKLGIQQ